MTRGLLEIMNDEELEGVIAHELSHVRNYDILTSSIAATIAGAERTWRRWADLRCSSAEWAAVGTTNAGVEDCPQY